MVQQMIRSRNILIAAVITGLFVVAAWQFVRHAWMEMQLSFADEQTEIFSEMTHKASEALRREPPDVRTAVEFLGYTHGYYPSGTKQTQGSSLDRIVERSRSHAERRIIEVLRDTTGEDVGTDAEAWVRKLGNYVEHNE